MGYDISHQNVQRIARRVGDARLVCGGDQLAAVNEIYSGGNGRDVNE
jgi:hypothetical protein